MATVNYVNPNTDPTVRVFNDFYGRELNINSNDYDVVLSFFTPIFADEMAARNFTLNVFQIARDSNTPVETILNDLSNQNQVQITATLAYYLNNLRSNATLLGISTTATPNQYAARNIVI
jgi:hypothetical protein